MSESKQNGACSKTGTKKIRQKNSQLEHILSQPESYIGSIEHTKELMWIYQKKEVTNENGETVIKGKMEQREISYVPGLYKIFDEILVNAADNKQRDKKMSCIRIDINPETNTISIWNNGPDIPVVMHKDEKMFVPTMIFDHLPTSFNCSDEEGAQLCNAFSTKFVVETASRQYKKYYKQTWGRNMSKVSELEIEDYNGKGYTKITFCPDLSKFKMDRLDDDIVDLMSRRAYDVAATSGASVYLNGDKLPITNFKDYISLYIRDTNDDSGAPLEFVYEHSNERWEIVMTSSDRGFQQVSFVNSIATTAGGQHVDDVVDLIANHLIKTLKEKNKGGINIKPYQVANHMWVFVNCLIADPTFDSPTKQYMLKAKGSGSKCVISEDFVNGVAGCGIVEKFKAQNDLAKTKQYSVMCSVPKLEDAIYAGTTNSMQCTLIITHKSLAVAGLNEVDHNHFGVLPLRGKLLNVREATQKQILENVEINNLIKVLGLQKKKKYLTMDDLKLLRYGKVLIMTDRDPDGAHFKGLLINFFHTNWPELSRLPFLEEFIMPIVKVKKKNEELSFYSLPEFEEWKAATANSNTYNVQYYNGLDRCMPAEIREYFTNMDRHRILFKHAGKQDDKKIVMAFTKKAVDQRKEWLALQMDECKRRKELGLQEQPLYTKTTKEITFTEFIDKELALYSISDNVRSIPSSVDGLKPGQRKVLFTCLKRNDKREVKVAQLAGSVVDQSAYHYGDVALHMTIINLAQNYVGSNNISLLQPIGDFGSRTYSGKDSASPHHIYTMLSPLTRLIFHPHDDPLLQYQYEDNQKIEPLWYIPIIPMVLVNGCEGIGTGWSTKIPNHNPRQIIKCLRQMIHGYEPDVLKPWYKNFKGSIETVDETQYISIGNVAIVEDVKIEITELPVGSWTQTYKEKVLEPMLQGSENEKPIITDYKEYHTHTTVRFVVSFAPGEFQRLSREPGGFHRVCKLTSNIPYTMVAFDKDNCLKRYNHANEILKEFFEYRLGIYNKRKDYLEGMLTAEGESLSAQARFIKEKYKNTLVVEDKKHKTLIDELKHRGYKADPVKEWKRYNAIQDEEGDESTGENLNDIKKYDYLVGMSVWMLTEESRKELLKQSDNKWLELINLKAKTPESMWEADLDALEKKLDEVEQKEQEEEERCLRGTNKSPAADGTKVEFKMTADTRKKKPKEAKPPKPPKPTKAKKVNYAALNKGSDGDEDRSDFGNGGGATFNSEDEDELFENDSIKEQSFHQSTSADMFDSLKQDTAVKKPAPTKRKLGRIAKVVKAPNSKRSKKVAISNSDDPPAKVMLDSLKQDAPVKKPAPTKRKLGPIENVVKAPNSKRSKKVAISNSDDSPAKMKISSDEDDDIDDDSESDFDMSNC